MKKRLGSIFAFAAPIALFLGNISVNSASYMFFHQPKVPSALLTHKKR